MRILDIMIKDLKQMLQERRSLLFLVAMPIVFTIFMGFASGGSGDTSDPRLAIGWINQDNGGAISSTLHEFLTSSDSLRLVELDPSQVAEANQMVSSGDLAAALVVPAGFSQATLEGHTPQISMVVDLTSGTGQSALELVRIPVTRVMSAVGIASLESKTFQSEQESGQFNVGTAFQEAAGMWKQSNLNGPGISIVKAQGQQSASPNLNENPYNQSSPGIMVMFAIFSLVTSATILVQERKTRTLERMLTTSTSRASIISGHMLAMFSLVLLQQIMLIIFGQLFLKVDYLREPVGTLIIMLALGLWSASVGLLIGVIAKGEDQVTLYALIGMFLLSGLGGVWFPLETAGKAFASIGKLTPTAWAMTGFQNILVRGLDTASVVMPSAILLAYAVGFFLLALWRFQANQVR
jgi:ABC-2 type transport system permease protein